MGGCIHGAWLKWRISNTATLSHYVTCSSGEEGERRRGRERERERKGGEAEIDQKLG